MIFVAIAFAILDDFKFLQQHATKRVRHDHPIYVRHHAAMLACISIAAQLSDTFGRAHIRRAALMILEIISSISVRNLILLDDLYIMNISK